MDVTEENMSSKEMLERIAELDYSQSQLRDLNAEMRHWLDVADDDITTLRAENATLKKQVNVLEKIISEVQRVEAEPCRSHLTDHLDVNRCREKKFNELEKESTKMKEQNKKLTAKLKSLQEEREQDKISLSKCRVALQTAEFEVEEAQSELQRRDEVIHQKNLQLKHLEETVEECSEVMKDLRLTNQELRKELEDSLDQASFAILNDLMRGKEGSLSPPLSFAEEIKLLVASAELTTSLTDSTDPKREETEAEESLKPESLTVLQNKGWDDTLETAVHRTGRFVLCIVILTVLALVALGSCVGNNSIISFNTVWSSARLMDTRTEEVSGGAQSEEAQVYRMWKSFIK